MSGTVLLISNRRAADSGGRAEKIATRKDLLKTHDWRVVVAHVPEPYILGFPKALAHCVWEARKQDVDAIISINNPFHLHVLGYLTSRIVRKPWLAELRDPIATHPDRNPNSPVTYLAKAVERLVVSEADHVVWFDGIQLADDYFSRYGINGDRITKLPPMGYHKAKFDAAATANNEAFTITYAGSFYEGWIEPYTFIQGLERYVKLSGKQNLCVKFYGDWSDSYQQAIEQAGIEDIVEVHDFVPHEEIVPILKGSDVLLYVGGDDPENRLNLPSKLWDYVGARRPILAIVDPSFRVADFLVKHDLGLIADVDEPEAVADAIKSLRVNYEFAPQKSVFDEYTRERSAERIADVLNDITNKQPQNDNRHVKANNSPATR
jgi:glycosyltransferase involved in cell wall biosynthesis